MTLSKSIFRKNNIIWYNYKMKRERERERKKLFILPFLLMFLSATLLINFFHTETILENETNCPACQFLAFSAVSDQVDVFHLPLPTIPEILKIYNTVAYTETIIPNPVSRAPPSL